ncbi:MAG: MetQ/NlpA family ABC transporter substrate-binding protein, partial [Coprococcus sp.]
MKKNLKRLLALTVTGALLVGALTGCGKAADDKTSSETTTAETTAAADDTSEEASKDESKDDGELKVITIAASATPHAEILEKAKPALKEKGYDLQITVFDDYVQPNLVVESGEFDANYIQHLPYLNNFNEEKGTHIVSVGEIHYEPFGIYPGT